MKASRETNKQTNQVYESIRDLFSENGTPFWQVYKVYWVYGRRFGYTGRYEKFSLKIQHISGQYTKYTGYTIGVPGIRRYTRLVSNNVPLNLYVQSSVYGYTKVYGVYESIRDLFSKNGTPF